MTIRVGLVGTGTVGCGCINILRQHKEEFVRHFGVDIELARVCSRRPDQSIHYGLEDIYTSNMDEIVNDPDIDLVVELIGGTTTARNLIISALEQGKSVVTANKALMALHGEEIMRCAKEHKAHIAFEASVGGGIPIIGPLKHSLIANDISSVMGIVNGTTNYMLTRMAEDSLSYDQALLEAQEAGYAEADPTADVDGLDAAAKIAILASIAFNSRVTSSEVPAEGIRHITPLDLQMANSMGYCIKLLAHAHKKRAGIDVRVHPTMLKKDHPLATVNGVFNAIYVVGDSVGKAMFFGEGAGAGPAASAVMGNVLEVARQLQHKVDPLVGCTCTDEIPRISMQEHKGKYYLRFKVLDKPGVLAATTAIFAQYGVSVYSMLQKGADQSGSTDLVYVTHTSREADIKAAIEKIVSLEGVVIPHTVPSLIRVED